jgi:hypothetical protein
MLSLRYATEYANGGKPCVVLLDDPFAALDNRVGASIFKHCVQAVLLRKHCVVLATPHTQCVLHFPLYSCASAAQALCRSRNTPHPVRASLPSLLLCFCSASTVLFSPHPTPSACFTSFFPLVLLQRKHCVVLATPHTQCVLHFPLYSCASAAQALQQSSNISTSHRL